MKQRELIDAANEGASGSKKFEDMSDRVKKANDAVQAAKPKQHRGGGDICAVCFNVGCGFPLRFYFDGDDAALDAAITAARAGGDKLPRLWNHQTGTWATKRDLFVEELMTPSQLNKFTWE